MLPRIQEDRAKHLDECLSRIGGSAADAKQVILLVFASHEDVMECQSFAKRNKTLDHRTTTTSLNSLSRSLSSHTS